MNELTKKLKKKKYKKQKKKTQVLNLEVLEKLSKEGSYVNTGLPEEARKVSNTQVKLMPQGAKERNSK